MYPVFPSDSIPAYSTSGRWIRSRVILTSTVSAVRTLCTRKVTEVPGLPFIRSEDSCEVSPAVVAPSMATISSPQRRPARAAGESA